MADRTGITDLCRASATDPAARIRRGDLLATDVTDAYLDRINERGGELNAYVVVVTDELARETAVEADRALESGDDFGPLRGVPIALTDLTYLKEGVWHTFGSAAFDELGLTEGGYPVGIQLVGRRYEDDTVLAASAAIERERSWHDTLLPVAN